MRTAACRCLIAACSCTLENRKKNHDTRLRRGRKCGSRAQHGARLPPYPRHGLMRTRVSRAPCARRPTLERCGRSGAGRARPRTTGSRLCSKQGPYVRDSPSDPADWPELSVPSPLGGLPVLSFLSERSLPNRTLRTASGWLAQPILSLRRARIRRGSPSYRRRSELSRLALPLLALFMCERRRCWLPVHVSGWENSLCVWSVLTPKKVDFCVLSKLSVPLGPRALYCPVRSCPYLPSPAPPAVRWTVRTFKIGVYNIGG